MSNVYCSIKLSTKCEDRIKTFSDTKGIEINHHHPSLGRLIFQHKGINHEKGVHGIPDTGSNTEKEWRALQKNTSSWGLSVTSWDWRRIWRKRKQACKHKKCLKNWFIISYILTFEKVLVSVWQFYWCFWKIWKRNKSNNTSAKMIE